MASYREVLVEVDDFGITHVKEEWEIVEEYMFICTTCQHRCLTSASLSMHWTLNHAPRGYDFVRYVEQWFSI